jgi:hypothetical protein
MQSKLSSQGIAHRRRPLRDTKRAEDPPSSRKSLREQKSYRGFWDSGYRFPPEIIQQAIWLYVRFTLSFRDVEDLLAERGILVSYSY